MTTIVLTLVLLSAGTLAAVCLLVWFLLALASAVPWWVLMAYYALRSAERIAHGIAGAPKRMHLVVTRADARL